MAHNHPTLRNGKICYIEIPARDIKESSVFYYEVFGWAIRTRDDGSVSFDDSTGDISGTWRTDRNPATEPGLLIYIMVEDITVTIKRIVANGGKITQTVGMEAPEVTARFSDPAGNVFGLYQHRELHQTQADIE